MSSVFFDFFKIFEIFYVVELNAKKDLYSFFAFSFHEG